MEASERLTRILAGKQLSRRGFMQAALALGVSTGAASGLWTRAQAATPQRGGLLRAGLIGGSSSDSLDPTTFNDTFMISVSHAIRNHLIDVGYGNTLAPALAESWESSPDSRVWRFRLRRGVEFANGKSLSVEDVIGSLNLHRGEASKSGAKGLFSNVTDISADGGDTIVITLENGNADLPYVLTDYHVAIVPVVDGKADVTTATGTGLYQLESFEPGISARLIRNPNAWQQGDLGHFDEAMIYVIADNTARQNALLSGEVDVINRPELKLAKRLGAAPGVRVETAQSNLHYTMPMQMDVGPFDNADFRMAMKYALNRQEFIDKILYGFGTIGSDHPIGPGFRFHDPAITAAEYDLDKARYHLEKSGLGTPSVTLSAADAAFNGAVDAAVLLSESAAQIGVNITVAREPNDGYWSNVWLAKPWCLSNWGSRPVEDLILSIAYLSSAEWNESHIRLEQLDQLIVAARAESDEAKRRQQYSDIQSIIAAQGGSLVPAFAQEAMLLSDGVATNGQYGGGWEMDGGHFIKRWWKA
ncbi:MAG: ABC transporter substrate-binding protein [Paenirhodobacter sp.]|uniref:ABC transporter substrate-binding protein n=1 Tax=Paenirhodobacter sp. TaxID=1965326 RepID=UPI003D0F2C42